MQETLTNIAVHYFLPFSLAMITLAMGLGLRRQDFQSIRANLKPLIMGIGGQILLLPALAFLTAFLFGLELYLAVGLVLLASCPGGAHSNLFTHLAKGDVALSISLTSISGLLSIITIPLYVYLATQVFTQQGALINLPILDTFIQLFFIVILPLFIGMFIKEKYPRQAPKIETIVKNIAILLLAFIIVGAVKNGWDNVVANIITIGAPVIFLNISAMLLGLLLALRMKLQAPQAVAIMMEVGIQNTTLAFGIAMTLLNNFEIAIPAMTYALWVYVSAFSAVFISRRMIKANRD